MFWVTAAPIHDTILAKVDSAPGIKALVLDMEETNQMDTTSVDALADLLGSLRTRDIDLYLVHVMWPVRKVLRRSGLMAELGEDHLWHSISQGVREARRAHGLKHLPATGGIAAAVDVPGEELLGQDAADEHLASRNPGPDHPDQHRPEST
jgi:anti-anti-sigma factor